MYKFLKLIKQLPTAAVANRTLNKTHFVTSVHGMQKFPESMRKGRLLTLAKIIANSNVTSQRDASVKPLPTKGEQELVQFLGEEIIRERKAQVHKDLNLIIDGFNMVFNDADVQLVKEQDNEKILISFNINHTVVTEGGDGGANVANHEKADFCHLRSKPCFEVNIIRGESVLSFVCSFAQPGANAGATNLEENKTFEAYHIDEICIFNKSWNDRVYAVEGTMVDGYLYDLLINMLFEKGINFEFAMKLSELATAHEHGSYIQFLENLNKFTKTENN